MKNWVTAWKIGIIEKDSQPTSQQRRNVNILYYGVMFLNVAACFS
jgi:hypothetical protein